MSDTMIIILSTVLPIVGIPMIVSLFIWIVGGGLVDFLEEYWPHLLATLFSLGGISMIIIGSLEFDTPNVLNLNMTFAGKICLVIFGSISFVISLGIIWWIQVGQWYGYDYDADTWEDYEEYSNEYNVFENDKNNSKNVKSKKLDLSNKKIDKFDEFFSNKIIGQNQATSKVKQQLIHCLYDLEDQKTRPAGVFFFVGPTGVGKTEMAKTLSEFLYNNKKLNRFDMSEYKSEMATQQLLGAPNGYVGYDEGGTLINAMKKNPNSIVLFDEIEKAHSSVLDLFLQILDEGTVTSNKGQKINFKNNFIIFTSNIGASEIEENMTNEESNQMINNAIEFFFTQELNRPEILGRIGKDNIIPFNMITRKEDAYKILDIYFREFIEQMSKKKIELKFNEEPVYDSILIDVDKTKGARDIRNEFEVFKKHFVSAMYENKLDYKKMSGKTLQFDYDNIKVTIKNNF